MEFVFSPEFNLIVGENGAGKTALLNAIAVAIGSWFLGIRGYDSRNIQDSDIRRMVRFIDKRFLISPQFPVSVSAIGSIDGKTITWKRSLEGPGGRTTQRNATKIKTMAEKAASSVMNGEAVTLPVISFYGAGRLWTEPRDTRNAIEKLKIKRAAPQDFAFEKDEQNDAEYFASRFTGYHYSVDDRCSPRDLLRWMRHERRIEIDEEEQSSSFRLVLSAIQSCLPEGEQVKYSIKYGNLMVTLKNKKIVPFKYLSDGYKNIIALVGDLAYKISQLNPHLGSKSLEETPGMVLIDELDEHLHPRWQRRVVADLRRTFPKIQFIAATHSPQIIGEVSHNEIILLKESKIELLSQSFGMDSNWILRHVMGADDQDPEVKLALKVIFDLIEDDRFEEAKEKIQAARYVIDGDHPDLAEASGLVERYTRIGK
jgi:predicted ATP-binding protein involved in virulence